MIRFLPWAGKLSSNSGISGDILAGIYRGNSYEMLDFKDQTIDFPMKIDGELGRPFWVPPVVANRLKSWQRCEFTSKVQVSNCSIYFGAAMS